MILYIIISSRLFPLVAFLLELGRDRGEKGKRKEICVSCGKKNSKKDKQQYTKLYNPHKAINEK